MMMHQSESFGVDPGLQRTVIALAMRLALVALLVIWCFLIFRPFMMIVIWGIILAVAFDPLIGKISVPLGGRRGLAAALLILLGFVVLAVPTLALSGSVADGIQALTRVVESGTVDIPPPPAKVAGWPMVGEQVYETWNQASQNFDAVLQKFSPQVRAVASWLISLIGGAAGAVLLTMLAVVIAVYLSVRRDWAAHAAYRVGADLAGERGVEFVRFTGEAIGTVAKGVVGVAVVQATLAAIGLFLAGVPGAGLWTALILILAVAQLPPLLVLAPAMVYVFSASNSTLGIVAFIVWSLFVSISDAFLKPLFLGRGSELPVPVILIGAIGGMILHGLIGLFVGAVVFSLGYRLVTQSMEDPQEMDAPGEPLAVNSTGDE
jgi:predicted PurR-regulated permease PerM